MVDEEYELRAADPMMFDDQKKAKVTAVVAAKGAYLYNWPKH